MARTALPAVGPGSMYGRATTSLVSQCCALLPICAKVRTGARLMVTARPQRFNAFPASAAGLNHLTPVHMRLLTQIYAYMGGKSAGAERDNISWNTSPTQNAAVVR